MHDTARSPNAGGRNEAVPDTGVARRGSVGVAPGRNEPELAVRLEADDGEGSAVQAQECAAASEGSPGTWHDVAASEGAMRSDCSGPRVVREGTAKERRRWMRFGLETTSPRARARYGPAEVEVASCERVQLKRGGGREGDAGREIVAERRSEVLGGRAPKARIAVGLRRARSCQS